MGFDPISALVMGGVSLVGSVIKSDQEQMAAKRARNAELASLDKGGKQLYNAYHGGGEYDRGVQDILTDGYDRSKSALDTGLENSVNQLNPYSEAGQDALGLYMGALTPGSESGFEESPYYQFQKQEMMKGISQQLGAMGKGRSGNSIQSYYEPAMMRLGANEVENYFNRLNPIINYGYNADTNISNLYSGHASNTSNLETNYTNNKIGLQSQYNNSQYKNTIGKGEANKAYELRAGASRANMISGVTNSITGGIGDMAKIDKYNKTMDKIYND